MMVFPPGLFTMVTGYPHFLDNASAITLPMRSVPAPGAKGTTASIPFAGYLDVLTSAAQLELHITRKRHNAPHPIAQTNLVINDFLHMTFPPFGFPLEK
jgi:hypothetical protein